MHCEFVVYYRLSKRKHYETPLPTLRTKYGQKYVAVYRGECMARRVVLLIVLVMLRVLGVEWGAWFAFVIDALPIVIEI